MPSDCQQYILSEDYTEFLISSLSMTQEILDAFQGICYQQIDGRFYSIYTNVENISKIKLNQFPYLVIPKLYGEMSTAALEISGITRIANQPALQLKGQGVIIGMVDSGIDYTHPAFLDEFGRSRILRLWDQTDPTGPHPEGIGYGTEYTNEDINRALASENPYDIVRQKDETGHGTFLAGVAAGSEDPVNDFSGAAPKANLIVVKLKPAKQVLRDYFFIRPDVPAYQENDIILGLNYIRRFAEELGMPISYPFGLGSNLGGHNGLSAISYVMNSISLLPGFCITVPTGNEGLTQQHFAGTVSTAETPVQIELSVSDNVPGVFFEIWGLPPSVLSISIESPTGEQTGRIPARIGNIQRFDLIFENSQIVVYYDLSEFSAGDEVIAVQIKTPTQGIWRIQVFSNTDNANFNAYLPGQNFIGNRAYFLGSSSDITLTDPSGVESAICVSGYETLTGAFYPPSGRGFTRGGRFKPDLCAPCTSITGPNLRGRYEQRSGTSLASALTGGACAQILTWAVTLQNAPLITSVNIKSILVRGANRRPDISYPSRLWGYGTLDLYNAFEILRKGGGL